MNITIARSLMPRIREGAQLVAEHDIGEAIDHGADLIVCRDQLDELCALLDAMQRRADVYAYAAILSSAIGHILPMLQDALRELRDDDPTRKRRDRECRSLAELASEVDHAAATAITTVPDDIAPLVRGGLYITLARCGSDFESACALDIPGDITDAVARFDRARALLDYIGWGKKKPGAITIDRRKHGPALIETLEDEWDAWEGLAEAVTTETAAGRRRARAKAKLVEQFLDTLGIARTTIPAKLRAVGINTVDSLCKHPANDLLAYISPVELIEVATALRAEGRGLPASRRGRLIRLADDRDMEFLRLRLIENMQLRDIAKRLGVSTEIPRRALRDCFGLTGMRRW